MSSPHESLAPQSSPTVSSGAFRDDIVFTPDGGLTEADVLSLRLAGKGNNTRTQAGRSVWDIIRANVFTRINAILGVLFLIVISTGSWINLAFGLLIIANSGIGMVQELRAKRMLDRLSIVGQAKPTVRRILAETGETGETGETAKSTEVAINRDELVEGDLICLASGDQVVVDGVVREAQSLDVDESLLTGESDLVHKRPGDAVMSGSFVVSGSGLYQATRVGKEAYAAQLAAEASEFRLTNSQLMAGINRILQVITWLLIPTGVLTVFTQLFRTGAPWNDAVLAMTAALVPMVPEGLVLMTSIAFALGVVRLGQKQCLVQELPAIEGLARVDVVCTDKTGTLTDNTMTFSDIVVVETAAGEWGVTPLGGAAEQKQVACDVVAAMAHYDEHPNDSMSAIAAWAKTLPTTWTQTSFVPFSSDKKWSGMGFGEQGEWLLGAPDVLALPGSASAQRAEEVGSGGARVLMLARSQVPVEDLAQRAAGDFVKEGVITPCALVLLQQSVRPDARDTLEYFQREGMEIKVLSGDNAVSVGAVAAELGMEGSEAPLDARTLPALTEAAFPREVTSRGAIVADTPTSGEVVADQEVEDFVEGVEHYTIFGRVTPEQKRLMVGALQREGHTVAMTGDGVNDVLALKRADIGVAMGSGSGAARSVAQIVLLDNRFATLPAVVAEGRRVIGNIERVANLFLTKTVYSVLLAILVIIAQVEFPFQPIHVTITGWFTIGIPAFLISLAPNTDRAKTGFVYRVLSLAVPSGIIVAAVTFSTYMGLRAVAPEGREVAMQVSTASLAALIITATWVLCVVARPLTWWKVALVVASAAMYPIIFVWPVTSKLFFLSVGDGSFLLWGVAAGLLGAVLVEVLWWVMGAVKHERRFVWARTYERVQEQQRQAQREESARVRSHA